MEISYHKEKIPQQVLCAKIRIEGADRAFEWFWPRRRRFVFNIAKSILTDSPCPNPNTDAEQVEQEVGIQIKREFQRLEDGEFTQFTNLDGWIAQITRNTALRDIEGHRKQRAVQLEPDKHDPLPTKNSTAAFQSPLPDPEHEFESRERIDLAIEILEGFDRVDRELMCRGFAGESHAEIAASLGMSEVAARKRRQRAKHKFNRALEERGLI